MGKARKIAIETRSFAKAGDATLFFRSMLNRYAIGDRLSDNDSRDLTALLKRHDEVDEKVGVGVSYFKVDLAPKPHSGRCFWIVRTNGTEIDFSVPHCLLEKPYDT
jgi:hypothetical protein